MKKYWNKYRKYLLLLPLLLLLFLLLNFLFPLPALKDFSPVIRDNKGQLVHAFLTKDDKWRMYMKEEELSPLLKSTLIRKEDRHFYYHPGVNPIALVRAVIQNIFSGKRVSGASTITMQVAKMLDPAPRTYGAKVTEMFRALQLEWKYSKSEIFQLYSNLLPYGGNIEGIKAASLLYFGKDPDHLSLAEITTLAIIPNRPTAWRIGPHNEALLKARNIWLERFGADKHFPSTQIRDALNEPLEAWRRPVPRYIPHLANRLKNTGGAIIDLATTIDLNTQLKTEQLVAAYVNAMVHRNIKNAAVLIIDNATGNAITYVGSSSFLSNMDGGQVDGIKAIRQPGSTLKPFLYGQCFDAGLYTPQSVLEDLPIAFAGYAPENYDRKFNGEVTLEYALEHSLNIPAVKAMAALGSDRFIQALIQAGFKTVAKKQRSLGLSVALGGCGASLEELTTLFAAIARGGTYLPAQYLQKGKSDTSHRAPLQPVNARTSDPLRHANTILSPAAAFMLTEILSKVNRPDFPLHWESTANMPKIAWKTGTSYGKRDAWSIGFNKKYTVGVWMGNFSGSSAPDLSGAQIATPLLFRVFNTIDYNSQESWFSPPKDCEIRMVCAETGHIPQETCPRVVMDYFIPLISPALTCDNRKEVMVSADERIAYCNLCAPETGYKKKIMQFISPEMQAWYEERKRHYVKIPPHNPDCEVLFKGNGPVITSPANGSVYYTTPKKPEPIQLSCNTGNDVLKVYWYINKKFYKAAAAGEKLYFIPNMGVMEISCTDDKGRTRSVKINVERY